MWSAFGCQFMFQGRLDYASSFPVRPCALLTLVNKMFIRSVSILVRGSYSNSTNAEKCVKQWIWKVSAVQGCYRCSCARRIQYPNYSVHIITAFVPNAFDLNTKQAVLGRTNILLSFHCMLSILYEVGSIENTASNSSYIVTCVFIAALKWKVWTEPLRSTVTEDTDMQTAR
jgi:hypothetical protein